MSFAAPPATGLSNQNPWPGLRAFTESDRDFFFGRERETAELLAIVKRSSVVVLYGQSGLGKTSLLQAGLFPNLKRLDFLPLRLRFDHSENAPPLAQQIKLALTAELDRAQVKAPRPGAGETLWEYFHRRDVDFWGPRNRLLTPVIVLDQFEEVFTLGQRNESTVARVAQFASELECLIEHRAPDQVRERLEQQPDEALNYDFQRQSVKFLLSLREDFLAQLDPWRARMPSLLPHRYRLERMTGAQALTVVESAGRDLVEADVAQEIVDFVSTSQRKRISHTMEQRDVEPALLSVVCDELNRRRIERGQARITADLLTVEREGIIQGFYERAFDGLDERVREWVEDELLTASGYRDRAAMEDALKQGLPESAFDLLVDRRVLHREERQGVVWLELTHDLLSDPAAQSRTARETKAAAKREAEFGKKLRRTRQLAAIFAVLLLGMVSAFVYMLVLRQQMIRAKAKADAMTVAATKATATAEENFQSLIREVDSRAEIIREYQGGDMRIPTATVRRAIDAAEQDFESLGKMEVSNKIAPSSDLELRHARFLAESGEALRQIGDFKRGSQEAEDALSKLNAMGGLRDAEKTRDVAQLTRAEALYVRGECRLATGDLTGARQDLEQSSHLVAGRQEAPLKHELDRVVVLSEIGLGDVEVRALAFGAASNDFEQALKIIKTLPASEDSNLWKVMALAGKGLSQKDDIQAERWLAEATKTLGGDKAGEDSNLRRKRLFAELAYQRGFVAYRLGKFDDAEKFFEQANKASEDLDNHDPDNLDWRLSQLQSWRGLGVMDVKRHEWDVAQEVLDRTDKAAKELNEAQPSWVQARFLRGVAILELGELIQEKYRELPDESRDQKDLDRALEKYTEARQWLQDSVQGAPKNVVQLAMAIASQAHIYYAHGFDSNLNPQAKAENFNRALQLFDLARQTLAPIQSTNENLMAAYDNSSGNAFVELKKPMDAIRSYQEAIKVQAELTKKSPTPDNYSTLGSYRVSLGAVLRDQEPAKAVFEYTLAAGNVDRALAGRPRDIHFLRQKADINAGIFDALRARGDFSGALAAMDAALTTVWSALQEDYSDKDLNDDLARYRSVTERTATQLGTAAKAAKGPGQPAGNVKAPTPQQSEVMVARIRAMLAKTNPVILLDHNQQRAWVLAPLIPGEWRTLGSPELETARSQLLAAKPGLKASQVLGIRKLPVDFYDNAALYEAEVRQENSERGIITYVQRGEKVAVLDGWRDRITAFNRDTPPRLDTVERATAYLRFYVGALQYEDGRVMLVDQLQDLHWLPTTTAEIREQTVQKIKPLLMQPSQGAGWQGIGTIQISRELYYAAFHLSHVGYVDIIDPAAATNDELPITVEGFLGGVRGPYTEEMGIERLEVNPNSETSLQKLPGRYAKVGRWKDAAKAQQRLLDSIQREAKSDAGQREKLGDTYATLARYQLRAGDFTGALAAADAGKKLDESSVALETYRAEALSFLGRTEEAEALYKKLEATAKAKAVLQDRVDLCAELKRWKETADAEQKLLAFTDHHAKSDEERRKSLPGEYLSLSWYQLMARDFAGALVSAEAGLKLDPSHLSLETNHAHALMFLGRTQEAEDLYRKYLGKKLPQESDRPWEEVILEDFDALQKEGVTSPEMERVRHLLKPEPGH